MKNAALNESGNVSEAQLGDDEIKIVISQSADLSEVEEILYPEGRTDNAQPSPAAGDYYTAVRVEDPSLVERLTENEVSFHQIQSTTDSSPFMSVITAWIIPTLLMYLLYYFFIRKVMRKIGSSNSEGGGGIGGLGSMFGAGKSKAKEYTMEKSTGVKFTDVAGQDEAKESLMEMVDFCIILSGTRILAQSSLKGRCWSALREPAKHFWQRLLPERQRYLFIQSPAASS